jgi:4-amino-4-deoxy-L-arabinose transferase-like glycosyltransferase
VFQFIKRNPRWFVAGLVIAVLLRFYFIWHIPSVNGDSIAYSNIARTILQHHVYGLTDDTVHATVIRMPGYPLMLAAVFALFGIDNFKAVMFLNLLLDVGTCLIVADIARRMFGDRAARWTFLLAATCPFIANYAASPLTEVPETFFTALAMHQAVIALQERKLWRWATAGAAVAYAILLRPDGGIILAAFLLVLLWQLVRTPQRWREMFAAGTLVCAVALAPLVPWTVRNYRVFHIIEPLVNRGALDPGEYESPNFGRWTSTWLIDYAAVENISFHVDGEPINIDDVPSHAFDSPQEREYVAQLFAEYNKQLYVSRDLDKKFEALAEQREKRHHFFIKYGAPALRTLDMLVRPRTEKLSYDPVWWDLRNRREDLIVSLLLAAWDVALIVAAVIGTFALRRTPYLGVLWVYPFIRVLFLSTIGSTEPRYTLECFPYFFVAAGAWFALRFVSRHCAPEPQPQATTAGVK